MRVHAGDPGAWGIVVIDADTGQLIEDVEWADEETGEYSQAVKGADGSYLVDDSGLVFKTKRGNIRLERRA